MYLLRRLCAYESFFLACVQIGERLNMEKITGNKSESMIKYNRMQENTFGINRRTQIATL